MSMQSDDSTETLRSSNEPGDLVVAAVGLARSDSKEDHLKLGLFIMEWSAS